MAAPVYDQFVLVGDSITQGAWEAWGLGMRLAHVYARKLDVLNRGYSGYNTDWGLPVFEQIVPTKEEQEHLSKVRLLTIWYGANDACLPQSPQHCPLPRFVSNMEAMIDTLTSPESPKYAPHTRIILITPPPVNTVKRAADLESRTPPVALDRNFDVTKQYAEAVVGLAKKRGLAYVDVWTAVWEAAGQVEEQLSRYLPDGLHLNGDGYGIVYQLLEKEIKSKHPELYWDNLKMVFPEWKEIDWENPGPTLQKRDAVQS